MLVSLPSCFPPVPFAPSPAFIAWLETLLPPKKARLPVEELD